MDLDRGRMLAVVKDFSCAERDRTLSLGRAWWILANRIRAIRKLVGLHGSISSYGFLFGGSRLLFVVAEPTPEPFWSARLTPNSARKGWRGAGAPSGAKLSRIVISGRPNRRCLDAARRRGAEPHLCLVRPRPD